jgi:hypothetical protein
MRRGAAIVATGAFLAVSAGADVPAERPRRGYANPSALIAAEIAFAQLAKEKGQWTAFRETAAESAVMFVPQPVDAREWTKKRANPAESVRWQPHAVWISCDGSMGVTRGAAQWPDGRSGRFTTVWQRQEKDGYRWVMDEGDMLAAPLPAPEMIEAQIASCEALSPAASVTPVPGVVREGRSRDGSLGWTVRVDPLCGRIVSVRLNRGSGRGFEDVHNVRTDPPPSSPGCAG